MFKSKKQFRYKGFDYSQPGFYFVTICTKNREFFFGDIVKGEMHFSKIGFMAEKLWQEIPISFSIARLDKYVVMPNHIHLVIEIIKDYGQIESCNGDVEMPINTKEEDVSEGSSRNLQPLKKNSLSSIINHFKGGLKKFCNKNNLEYFAWQDKFYDHIIRDENDLDRIRQYIDQNIVKWDRDRNNRENLFM